MGYFATLYPYVNGSEGWNDKSFIIIYYDIFLIFSNFFLLWF